MIIEELFICDNCNKSFEPTQCGREIDHFFEKTYLTCPYCGSLEDEFIEAAECKVCEEAVALKDTVDGCCKDCLETIFEEEFDYYIEDFAKLFPENEREEVISDYRQDNSPGKKDFRAIYDTSDIYECIAKEQ